MSRASEVKAMRVAAPGLDEPPLEHVAYDFGISRRSFMKGLGAGLCISVSLPHAPAQNRAGGESGGRSRGGFLGSGAANLAARIHIATDGRITVMAGKVEGGQGARAELLQAAAEELGVAPSQVTMVLADTGAVPDDGMTAGSGTTPRTVPAVRRGAAFARNLLVAYAAGAWKVERASLELRDGRVVHAANSTTLSYADLGRSADAERLFAQTIPENVTLTATKDWKVMGTPVLRPNAREIVTGAHQYPSDVQRPGMLYAKILRAPAYGARLEAIDLAPARAMRGVVAFQDDQLVGVAAENTSRARAALEAIAKTAKWQTASTPQPSSQDLFEYLRQNAEGGMPRNPFATEIAGRKSLSRAYQVAYIQHAPLEPRAAVAEWQGGKLTVWTGSQNPFGLREELIRAFHLGEDKVRVVIPDFGGGFGGKHTAECAVEAARVARAAGKPVSLRWTREEEFTWAYFRPAAAIDAEASLDEHGRIATWHFLNINSGPSALETPYTIAKKDCRFIESKPPLRHGSYRGLAATANNFAREVFMDELAAEAGADPLDFRMAHIDDPRLRAVLEKAADAFGWRERAKQKDTAIGLACGVEKGSYVAACADVSVDQAEKTIKVRRVCQAYECGAIVNPANLLSQVEGAIVMGLGGGLREAMEFDGGCIRNASFGAYKVPRFDDVPELDVHLMNRPGLPSAGAGETPIICVAPAIANAVFRATGKRVDAMPIRLA
jgi:CO/xanthine dehydrogenase Mo-binding subunit